MKRDHKLTVIIPMAFCLMSLRPILADASFKMRATVQCQSLLRTLRINLGMNVNHRIADKHNFYWHFPSDHLPVVGLVSLSSSNEQFKILSWNVLNTNYLHHIVNDENSQGLKVSEITETKDRSQRIIDILTDIARDVAPAIIGLQEVDDQVLRLLETWAKQRGFIVFKVENPAKNKQGQTIDYGVILVESRAWTTQENATETVHFTGSRGPVKYIQKLNLRSRAGAEFSFVNVHKDFTDTTVFLDFLRNSHPGALVVVGDLNLTRPAVVDLLNDAPAFSLMPKKPDEFTHIDTQRNLSDYDHVLYSGNVVVTSDRSVTQRAQKHFWISEAR